MHPSAGGPPIVVERLSQLAPSEGWEAAVITTSLYCDDDGKSLQNSLCEHLNAKVLPIRGPRFLKYAYGAAEAINNAVQVADIVHLHTLWHPLNSIARAACRRHGRKYALMPHGMLDPYSLRQKRLGKKIYLETVERRTLQEASRLIFTALDEQQAAQQSLHWLAPGEVIPLAADCPPYDSHEACADTFTRLFPQVADRPCILFLGRIHPKKGLERLLRLMPDLIRRHPETLLVVAGNGECTYVKHVKRLVRSLNLNDHVLFTGMIKGQAKWGAFACADIFLLPSSQENFAIAVAEAMHMAVPVIISKKVNSWPFVKRANAGFVLGEDEIELSLIQCLDELLCAPDTAKCLGKHGQDFAREYLTWPRVAKDIVSLYYRMLSE
jgi:glycosyltransferase involved in cell wall biosynthesis